MIKYSHMATDLTQNIYNDIVFNTRYEMNLARFFDLIKFNYTYIDNDVNFSPNFILRIKNKNVNVYIKLNKQRSNKDRYIKKIKKSEHHGDYLIVGTYVDELFFYTNLDNEINDETVTCVTLGFMKKKGRIFDSYLFNCTKCNKITLCTYDGILIRKCYFCKNKKYNVNELYTDFALSYILLDKWHLMIKTDTIKHQVDNSEVISYNDPYANTYKRLISFE